MKHFVLALILMTAAGSSGAGAVPCQHGDTWGDVTARWLKQSVFERTGERVKRLTHNPKLTLPQHFEPIRFGARNTDSAWRRVALEQVRMVTTDGTVLLVTNLKLLSTYDRVFVTVNVQRDTDSVGNFTGKLRCEIVPFRFNHVVNRKTEQVLFDL